MIATGGSGREKEGDIPRGGIFVRRMEREVTGPAEIDRILQACSCCRVAFATGGAPYIVPLNFGWRRREGGLTLYFHGAPQGRKAALAAQRPLVGFELDCGHQLQEAGEACGYSYFYESIVGAGRLEPVEDPAEKREALGCIMAHYTGRADWAFPQQALQQVLVLRLEVSQLSCKAHRPGGR